MSAPNTISVPMFLEAALALVPERNTYQRDLLLGYESLSGNTLRGKALKYKGHYQASARSMLRRLRAAGIPCGERIVAHGKRQLYVGPESLLS